MGRSACDQVVKESEALRAATDSVTGARCIYGGDDITLAAEGAVMANQPTRLSVSFSAPIRLLTGTIRLK